MKARYNFGEAAPGGSIIIKFILKKQLMKVWIGFKWLRIRSSVELLCMK
jgi:hypothetical protein